MQEIILTIDLSEQIAALYTKMESEYDTIADALHFSCTGCPDNCCDSYFQHHTYIEWAYLWQGVMALNPDKVGSIMKRAVTYVTESERLLAQGERPQLMCPINNDGLCSLYTHRLMICRLHGVPASLTRPDGKKLHFPGCFQCQERVSQLEEEGQGIDSLERTELYRQLVDLEVQLLGHRRHVLPKVKLSLAQMLVQGPPRIP